MELENLWTFIESKMRCIVPMYLRNLLAHEGFDCFATIKNIMDDDIYHFEFVGKSDEYARKIPANAAQEHFYGSFSRDHFQILRGHKVLLREIAICASKEATQVDFDMWLNQNINQQGESSAYHPQEKVKSKKRVTFQLDNKPKKSRDSGKDSGRLKLSAKNDKNAKPKRSSTLGEGRGRPKLLAKDGPTATSRKSPVPNRGLGSQKLFSNDTGSDQASQVNEVEMAVNRKKRGCPSMSENKKKSDTKKRIRLELESGTPEAKPARGRRIDYAELISKPIHSPVSIKGRGRPKADGKGRGRPKLLSKDKPHTKTKNSTVLGKGLGRPKLSKNEPGCPELLSKDDPNTDGKISPVPGEGSEPPKSLLNDAKSSLAHGEDQKGENREHSPKSRIFTRRNTMLGFGIATLRKSPLLNVKCVSHLLSNKIDSDEIKLHVSDVSDDSETSDHEDVSEGM